MQSNITPSSGRLTKILQCWFILAERLRHWPSIKPLADYMLRWLAPGWHAASILMDTTDKTQ